MLIIINADDLGASKEMNSEIFDLMFRKLISSSTIMANGPAVEDAAKKAKNFPECSFGIHLNIIDFSALSSTNALKALLDERGNFAGNQKLREIFITPSLSVAIYIEFCAQVERLLSLGIKISHVDSHHHIHTIPRIFPILKRLQAKYGIRKVRISRNIYLPGYPVSKILLFKKKIYNFMLRHYYSTKTTSGFCNLVEFYENAKTNNLKHKSVEIMVHPGNGRYSYESAIFDVSLLKQLPIDFKLINYNEL